MDAGGAGGAAPELAAGDDFDPLEALRERLLAAAEPYGLAIDPARRLYPALWKLLTVREGAQGKRKQPANLRLEATPTGFRVTLQDLTLSVALSVDVEELAEAFPAMERAIRNPKAPWRELRHGERARAIKSKDSKNKSDWES